MSGGLEPGCVVGRFRVTHQLGRGGMGTVWAAEDEGTARAVALKVLREGHADGAARRMLREALAGQAIDHPNVAPVREVIELADGSPVLVMDRLYGETLAARLRRRHVLTLAEAARVLLPVMSAVAAAHHRGIVHRDIKPENVFLVEEAGREPVVKVLDFGIAKVTSSGALDESEASTETGALLGTPFYMSPEQVFGERDVDHRADIWAIGLVAYECLSGVLPTRADRVGQVLKIVLTRPFWPLRDVVPDLPVDVAAMIDRLLARDRDERPFELREVAEVLLAHYDGAELPDFPAPSERWKRPDAPRSTTPASEAATTTDPRASMAVSSGAEAALRNAGGARSRRWPLAALGLTTALTAVGVAIVRPTSPHVPARCVRGVASAVGALSAAERSAPSVPTDSRPAPPAAAPTAVDPPPGTSAAARPIGHPGRAAGRAMAAPSASMAAEPPEPSRTEILNQRK